jgi:hypothetical protein
MMTMNNKFLSNMLYFCLTLCLTAQLAMTPSTITSTNNEEAHASNEETWVMVSAAMPLVAPKEEW